ncbi:hypothetical protein MOSE0_J01464 [Monosporozyma servazzii]
MLVTNKNINRKKKHNKIQDDKRDIFGRNLSYLLSCHGSTKQITQQVNPYSHDMESGNTPMHVLLSRGEFYKAFKLYQKWKSDMEYLSHKFSGHIFEQFDRNGLNPLELYNVMLSDSFRNGKWPKFITYKDKNLDISTDLDVLVHWDVKDNVSHPIRSSFTKFSNANVKQYEENIPQGSHILTLGSNTHYNLGTGNKDDRQNFFQLQIDQLHNITFPPSDDKFTQAYMTKYNSLITTRDNEVFVCGNGSRGRLGTGSNDKYLFSYTKLNTLPSDIIIKQISTSDHHTLLLCDNESTTVYSWGWNSYFQLGYQTTNSNKLHYDESACGLVPRRINFLENKKISMVACSKIHSCAVSSNGEVYLWGLNVGQMGKISHSNEDVEYLGQHGHIVINPIIINLKHLKIEQIICTEFVTFIRSENNVLTVFVNNTIKTFKIPLAKSKNLKESDAFNHFTKREIPSKVVDMKCSNKFGNNVCFRYACGRLGIINLKNESPHCWGTLNNNVLPVNLLWIPNFNFRKCLDFGVGFKGDTIVVTSSGEVFKTKTLSNNTFEKIHSSKLLSGRVLKVSCNSTFGSFVFIKEDTSNVPILYRKDGLATDFAKYSPFVPYEADNEKSTSCEFNKKDYCSTVKPKFSEYDGIIRPASLKEEVASDAKFDICFVDDDSKQTLCFAHKLILKTRCKHLMESLESNREVTSKDGTLTLSSTSDIVGGCQIIKVSGSNSSTIRDIIHYIYTDKKPDKQQVNMILLDLIDGALHFEQISDYLHTMLSSILNEESIPSNSLVDTEIELEDGSMYAHSMVLSSRSSYFKSVTSHHWIKRNKDGIITINLKHISKDYFYCIISYLYGSPYDKAIQNILQYREFSECLLFLSTLLEYTNELLLYPFKNYLESILAKYINQETVFSILINAYTSKATLLVLVCNMYITTSIGTLFSKEVLPILEKYFDDNLWKLLEEHSNYLLSYNRSAFGKLPCWYDNSSINWINLFNNDIDKFNGHFMPSGRVFKPVFDLKTSSLIDNKPKSSGSSRRRSSVLDHPKIHSSLHSSQSHIPPQERRSSSQTEVPQYNSSWKKNSITDTAIDDEDTDEFIEVRKNNRTKTSEAAPAPKLKSPNYPTKEESEVLLHTQEKENLSLPSLLSSGASTPIVETTPSHQFVDEDPLSHKTFGAFKKNNQRQRRKQFVEEEQVAEKVEHKPAWKLPSKNETSQPTKTEKKRKSVKKPSIALPSLLTTASIDIKEAPKKNIRKSAKKKPETTSHSYTEFVSTGNPGGIRPYVTSNKVEANEISAVFANPNSTEKTSAEEKLAAMEFEKWFAEESAKVQKQLKNDRNKNNIEAVFGSSQTLPDFLAPQDNTHKSKKKIKAKFSGKNKKGGLKDLNDLDRLL